MVDKNLERIMEREWQDVRKGFHYPQLPQPKLVDNIPNGSIDMKSLQIQVSQPFIEGFEEHDIEEDEAMNEALTHELTHFMKYPGSVLNVLRLQKTAQGLTDGNKVSALREAFTEAQTNIYLVNEKKHPATSRMRKAYGLPEEDHFGKLMYGLYQEVSGQDFGVTLTEEEQGIVSRLKDIDFLDKKRETNNFRKFVQTLKDYQPPQKNQEQDKQGSQGDGGESKEQSQGSSQGNPLDMFSENQIREGIRQFAQECNNPEEFEDIVKQVLSEGEEKGEPQDLAMTSGRKAGVGEGTMIVASSIYSALADNYTIPIRKKQLHKNGGLFPHSHEEFSVGDSIHEIDPFSAPGILPGITKKWKRKEGEVTSDFEDVPDSVIVIDNSGSMPDPRGEISVPILGATAISNAYLDNGSKVAVYNFGGQDYLLNFTKDKRKVHEQLRVYTGGGTTFNSRFLENTLKENEGEFDISVVSDMDISNVDRFVDTMLAIQQMHRIHLFYTDPHEGYVSFLREKFRDRENVTILPLTRKQDIEKVVMGELKRSVR